MNEKTNKLFVLASRCCFILQHDWAENGQRVGEKGGDINSSVKIEQRLTGGHSRLTCLRLIPSPAPSTHRQRPETREFGCIILSSLTWQNLPFNEIRCRVLRRKVSFQGHNSNNGEMSSAVSPLRSFQLIFTFIFSILKVKHVPPVEDFLHLDETYDAQVKSWVSIIDKFQFNVFASGVILESDLLHVWEMLFIFSCLSEEARILFKSIFL